MKKHKKQKKHKIHDRTPSILICPIHKIQIGRLYSVFYDSKVGRTKSKNTKWYWCEKCNKPIRLKLVIAK